MTERTALQVAPEPAPVAIDRAGSIVELLHAAVKQGTPVAELKELVALHEHMEEREARRQYFDALRAFQRQVGPIKKSETAKIATRGGGGYAYTFAPLDEIVRTIGPCLDAANLSYRWDTTVEKGTITVICTVSHVAGHSEQSSMTLPIDNASAMSDQQKVGAAMTFGQRRTLTAALGLVTTDEEAPRQELDPTPISEDQVTVLVDLLAESGADEGRFLRYIGYPSLDKIPAVRFSQAVQAIRDRAREAEAKSRTRGGGR